MALIPILAMVILVGVFATFVISFIAFILYYMRAGKARRQADLVRQSTPAEQQVIMTPSPTMQTGGTQAIPASVYVPPAPMHYPPGVVNEPVVTPSVQQSPSYRSFSDAGFTSRQPHYSAEDRAMSMFQEYNGEKYVPVDPSLALRYPIQGKEYREPVQEDEGMAWM